MLSRSQKSYGITFAGDKITMVEFFEPIQREESPSGRGQPEPNGEVTTKLFSRDTVDPRFYLGIG
jgi:hypothetical protein